MNRILETEAAIREAEELATNARRKGSHGAARKHQDRANRLRKKLRKLRKDHQAL